MPKERIVKSFSKPWSPCEGDNCGCKEKKFRLFNSLWNPKSAVGKRALEKLANLADRLKKEREQNAPSPSK